jgi:hypothetical protein
LALVQPVVLNFYCATLSALKQRATAADCSIAVKFQPIALDHLANSIARILQPHPLAEPDSADARLAIYFLDVSLT